MMNVFKQFVRRYLSADTVALSPREPRDAVPMARIALTRADVEQAVRTLDTFVDVQVGELLQLYNLAVEHAFDRQLRLTCRDVMSRNIVTVAFNTELEEAWKLLRAHKIKALPVVDRFGTLIGILTVSDFLRQLGDTMAADLAVRLQELLRRTPGETSENAMVVGQIMTASPQVARLNTPISDLVRSLSDKNLNPIPVLDEHQCVVGMVTQSDLIAALYMRIVQKRADA